MSKHEHQTAPRTGHEVHPSAPRTAARQRSLQRCLQPRRCQRVVVNAWQAAVARAQCQNELAVRVPAMKGQ
eukprot:773434-Karenia_brevis.AAC.1